MARVENKCGSPMLKGNFAPIEDEMDVAALEVSGSIPPELSGLYLRNGPNPMFEPLGQYHWFDGDGMLHGIRLENGKASYRNRWVRSRGLDAEESAGRAIFGGMNTLNLTDTDLAAEAGGMKNTANTNVIRHGGK